MARHAPHCRLQPVNWSKVDGEWRLNYGDGLQPPPDMWEVCCAECGDDNGPYDEQSDVVKRLRGPYPGRDAGLQAAAAHASET